ncbi:MAG: hypothetical protein EAZ65_06455, partial [Verrucomicrobia bacterium]
AISYDGSSNPPVAAGSYPVSATITDPNYQGSASGTLVITKADATIQLSDLTQTYDGSPKSVSSSTTPAGLAVAVSYDGSSTPPAEIGSYAVNATIEDPNYEGSATGSLTIQGISYALWSGEQFNNSQSLAGLAAPNGDPDADGLANLAEYALASNPNEFTPQALPQLSASHLTLQFERPLDRVDATCHAEFSSDLITWTEQALEVIELGPNRQTLRARVLRPAQGQALFLRLRFE